MTDRVRRVARPTGEVPEEEAPEEIVSAGNRSGLLINEPSPRRQNMAIAHAAWTKARTDVYDAQQSLAWAHMMEPQLDENPELEELFLGDFGTAIAAMELDDLLPSVPGFNISLKDKVMQATNDQLFAVRNQMRSADELLVQAAATDDVFGRLRTEQIPGNLDITTGAPDLAFRSGDELRLKPASQVPLSDLTRFLETGPQFLNRVQKLAQGAPEEFVDVAGSFLANVRGSKMTWVGIGDRYAIQFEIDDKTFTFDLRLDGGIGDTAGDLLGAITEALWGQQHEILQAEKLPGGQTIFGLITEFTNDVFDPVFRVKDRFDYLLNWTLDGEVSWTDPLGIDPDSPRRFRNSEQVRADEFTEMVDRVVATEVNPDDFIVAGIALAAGDGGTYLAEATEAFAGFRDLPQEQQDAIEDQLRQAPTRQQVEQDLEGLKDDRHSVKRAMDDAALATMGLFGRWEQFVQGNFVSFVDFFNDLGEGLAEGIFVGDESGEKGFEVFTAAFEWETGSAAYRGELNAADFFGLDEDDPWRGAVNFAASIVGDPFTWTLAGGVMRAAEMSRLMKSEAGVVEWMSKPHTQPWLSLIESSARGGNTRALSSLFSTTGISDNGLRALMRPDANVQQILVKEMTEQFMVPTLTGGLKFRNSAQWVARMSKWGDTKVGTGLKQMLGQFSNERTIPLSVSGFRPKFNETLLGRSTIGKWNENPALYDRWLDETMLVADPNQGATRKLIAERIEANAADRTALTQTGRDSGHIGFLQAEDLGRTADDRLARLKADLRALENDTLDAAGVDDLVRETQAKWAAEQTPKTKAAFDDALELQRVAEGSPEIQQTVRDGIERKIELLENGDELRGQAARDVSTARTVDDVDEVARREVDERLTQIDEEIAGGEFTPEEIEALQVEQAELLQQADELRPQLEVTTEAQQSLFRELEALGARFPQGLRPGTPEWNLARDEARVWSEQMGVLNKRRQDLRSLKSKVDLPSSRAAKDDLVERFWKDWGEELFLGAKVEGEVLTAERLAAMEMADMPWDLITGVKTPKVVADVGAELAERAGQDSKLNEIIARALGPSVRGSTAQPVSVMNAVAYQARSSDSFWAKVMIPNPKRAVVRKSLDAIRTAFAFNVLMNPFTWIRSNLDEPLRHWLQRGFFGRQSEVLDERIPGAFVTGLRRMQATFGADAGMDDLANQFARTPTKPYADFGNKIEFVARTRAGAAELGDDVAFAGKGEFMASSRNFINGVLPNQPMWQQYGKARHFDDEAGFFSFWTDGGGRLEAGVKIAQDGAEDLTASELLRSMDGVVDYFAGQITNEASSDAFRAAFWKKLATGENVSDNLLRQLKWMPASTSKTTNLIDSGFHWLFARPAEVHTGIVAKDFYEQTLDIYTGRFGDRILTAARLAEQMDVPIELAQAHLWMGSPYVDDLVRNQGFVTEKMMHVEASRIAKVHADHMAYSMGASTLGGERMAQAFPFLRAQLDFLGFYRRELTNGTVFNPQVSAVLRKFGARQADLVQLPGLPLNLRLASRMADFGGALSTIPEDSDDKFRDFIDDFTFLPSSFDDRLWLQLEPGLAPIPNWLGHGLPVEGEGPVADVLGPLRRFLDAASPAFGFDESVTPFWPPSAWGDTAGAFVGSVFPDSSRSASRVGITGARGIAGLFDLGAINTWMGKPPGFDAENRNNLVEALMNNPMQDINSFDYQTTRDDMVSDAWNESSINAARSTAARWLPIAGGFILDAPEGGFLDGFARLMGSLAQPRPPTLSPAVGGIDWLHANGFVGDAQLATIRNLWAKWEDGDITFNESSDLASDLSSILFALPDSSQNLVVALHPELAVNMVSHWEVIPERVPDDITHDGTRLVVNTEERSDIVARGKREGWLIRSSPETVWDAAFARAARAIRGVRNDAWTATTGLLTFQKFPALPDEPVNPANAGLLLDALGIDDTNITNRGELAAALNDATFIIRKNIIPFDETVSLPPGLDRSLTVYLSDLEDAGFDRNDAETWPIVNQEYVRELFEPYVNSWPAKGSMDPRDYDTFFAPRYGQIGFEPVTPPKLSDVQVGVTSNTYRLTVPAGIVTVVDGDTVSLPYPDIGAAPFMGEPGNNDSQRIRLIGVNAAEKNHIVDADFGERGLIPPSQRHTDQLQALIDGATTIDFVVFEPDKFAVLQEVDGGEVRWLMVMYIDGEPIWDPSIFTADNPTGAAVGGRGLDVSE